MAWLEPVRGSQRQNILADLNNFDNLETIFEKSENHFEKLEKQKVAQH